MHTAEFGEAMAMSAIAREEAERALKNYFEWISVKDRLPEAAGWYLVFYNGSAMQVAFFKGRKWPFDNHYHKITHWMPLPEPPKEDA